MSKIPETEAGKEKKQKKKSGMEWIAVEKGGEWNKEGRRTGYLVGTPEECLVFNFCKYFYSMCPSRYESPSNPAQAVPDSIICQPNS